MACFIVPATEAVISTVATKVVKSKESKHGVSENHSEVSDKISFSTKLGWLNKLLVGGSVLLAFEHVWHGEVIASFPFLTAIQTGETAGMLQEMSTTGVLMAVAVTTVWAGMLAVSSVIEKRTSKVEDTAEEA